MKEERTTPLFYIGVISQLLLGPLMFLAYCYSWGKGIDMADAGIYLPQPLSMALFLLPIIAFVLLVAWAILKKEHTMLHLISIAVAVGIIFSIVSAEVVYAHPEEFNLYRGERFFVATTPDEIIEAGSKTTPALVFIDDGDKNTYSLVSYLVGKNHLTLNYYDSSGAAGPEAAALDECMEKFGISYLPAVFITSDSRALYLFEGDTLEENLREYFDIIYP